MNSPATIAPPRLLLPFALAVVAIRGSVMPWITVRPFDGEEYRYDLASIRGGIAIIFTIAVIVLIGLVVGLFRRMAGMTIMSLGVAALGWMAAISGTLMSLLWSLIPSINVAGLDLLRATLSQGSGVVVTVVASLALAFMVVRQLDLLRDYTPSTHVSLLPILVLVPLIAIAVSMHSGWLRLGSEGAGIQAVVSGDSLYGSGLVVLALWLAVGLWIGALMIHRAVMVIFGSVATVLVALIVGMYAGFLWIGGRALDWLVPASLERWTTVSFEPQLFIVMGSALLTFLLAIGGFVPTVRRVELSIGSRVSLSTSRVALSDLVGGGLLLAVAVSVILRAL
jgi:hypothetical protein